MISNLDDAITAGALAEHLAALPPDTPIVATFEGCAYEFTLENLEHRAIDGRPVLVIAWDDDLGRHFDHLPATNGKAKR